MKRTQECVAALLVFAGASIAAAQRAPVGAGKVEIGGFPIGGTFLVRGDDDREVNFNVYSAGAGISCYVNKRTAIEGELSIGFGLAQDVMFRKAQVLHVQMPNVWSYFGNVVYFPGGATARSLAFYVTAGAGAVSLQSRQPTKPFGYDAGTVGFESFIAENVGAGVKIFRASVPDWGFRVDYRYVIVNANGDAPAFFAKTKSRGGHRIAFGILHTLKSLTP
jgi:hypothetical protein